MQKSDAFPSSRHLPHYLSFMTSPLLSPYYLLHYLPHFLPTTSHSPPYLPFSPLPPILPTTSLTSSPLPPSLPPILPFSLVMNNSLVCLSQMGYGPTAAGTIRVNYEKYLYPYEIFLAKNGKMDVRVCVCVCVCVCMGNYG